MRIIYFVLTIAALGFLVIGWLDFASFTGDKDLIEMAAMCVAAIGMLWLFTRSWVWNFFKLW